MGFGFRELMVQAAKWSFLKIPMNPENGRRVHLPLGVLFEFLCKRESYLVQAPRSAIHLFSVCEGGGRGQEFRLCWLRADDGFRAEVFRRI